MSLKISLFTPTHNPSWLFKLYESLKNQDFYEWVIVYNNGAIAIDFKDDRVRSIMSNYTGGFVGAAKAIACNHAQGDILVELDHDDLLTPNAIEEIKLAFEDESVGFVYSNALFCDAAFKNVPRFDNSYGWEYRTTEFDGHQLDELVSFNPTPAAVSRIWFAPNHVRAFRKSVYDQVGGYNKNMRVLDDQDIMCRMYNVTKFHLIDKALYVYRVHGNNTWQTNCDEIQNNVYRLYDQYMPSMAEKWSKDNNLRLVELGGRMAAKYGFETVDLRDADIISDLNDTWPFEDNSVGVIRSFDVFEHLKDPIHTMMELYRVLAPGGYAFIQVPSTDGRGAFQDPTHVSFYNENSFMYYTDRDFNKYIDCPVRFQSIRCYTTEKDSRGVCWVVAHLMKLGDERVPGIVSI